MFKVGDIVKIKSGTRIRDEFEGMECKIYSFNTHEDNTISFQLKQCRI